MTLFVGTKKIIQGKQETYKGLLSKHGTQHTDLGKLQGKNTLITFFPFSSLYGIFKCLLDGRDNLLIILFSDTFSN